MRQPVTVLFAFRLCLLRLCMERFAFLCERLRLACVITLALITILQFRERYVYLFIAVANRKGCIVAN
ncbi:hypothetical protein DF133_13190 [Burkholderia cenocepacia]|nr:hypothetical protein DF133_13190 [Burkholderia cenocepacia]